METAEWSHLHFGANMDNSTCQHYLISFYKNKESFNKLGKWHWSGNAAFFPLLKVWHQNFIVVVSNRYLQINKLNFIKVFASENRKNSISKFVSFVQCLLVTKLCSLRILWARSARGSLMASWRSIVKRDMSK